MAQLQYMEGVRLIWVLPSIQVSRAAERALRKHNSDLRILMNRNVLFKEISSFEIQNN